MFVVGTSLFEVPYPFCRLIPNRIYEADEKVREVSMRRDEEEADMAGRIPAAKNNIVFFCAFEKEDQPVKRNMRNIKSNITP